jgi:hypothetical protein
MFQKFSLEREHMKLRRTRSEKNKTNRTKRSFGISLLYQINDKYFAIASYTQKHVYYIIGCYNFSFYSVWVQDLLDHIKYSIQGADINNSTQEEESDRTVEKTV